MGCLVDILIDEACGPPLRSTSPRLLQGSCCAPDAHELSSMASPRWPWRSCRLFGTSGRVTRPHLWPTFTCARCALGIYTLPSLIGHSRAAPVGREGDLRVVHTHNLRRLDSAACLADEWAARILDIAPFVNTISGANARGSPRGAKRDQRTRIWSTEVDIVSHRAQTSCDIEP